MSHRHDDFPPRFDIGVAAKPAPTGEPSLRVTSITYWEWLSLQHDSAGPQCLSLPARVAQVICDGSGSSMPSPNSVPAQSAGLQK